MNFTRYILTILVWALILEFFVFFYYLVNGGRTFEFYLNLALMFLTILSIGLILYRAIKRRRKDGKNEN